MVKYIRLLPFIILALGITYWWYPIAYDFFLEPQKYHGLDRAFFDPVPDHSFGRQPAIAIA